VRQHGSSAYVILSGECGYPPLKLITGAIDPHSGGSGQDKKTALHFYLLNQIQQEQIMSDPSESFTIMAC